MLPIAEENCCERSGLLSQLSWRRHLSFSEPRTQHVPVNTQNKPGRTVCRDRDLGRRQVSPFPAASESSKGVHLTAHHLSWEHLQTQGSLTDLLPLNTVKKSKAPVPGAHLRIRPGAQTCWISNVTISMEL